MAVAHIVWIRFNDGVSPQQVEQHLAALTALKDEVPGITGLTIGENFTDRADGYTHGLTVILADKGALQGYATHPYHVEVATRLRDDAGFLVMDYEF